MSKIRRSLSTLFYSVFCVALHAVISQKVAITEALVVSEWRHLYTIRTIPRRTTDRFRETSYILASPSEDEVNGDDLEDDGTFSELPSDAEVVATTMNWIQKSIIGLNLCPFAERPIKKQQLTTRVIRGDNPMEIAEAVLETMIAINATKEGTALVIVPEFFPEDFNEYMRMVRYLEEGVMEHYGLHGWVQIALFHPFLEIIPHEDGTASSGVGVESYTNKSPHPMFHILKEEEVSRAVDLSLNGDPGKVWRRNVKLLQTMAKILGIDRTIRMLRAEETVEEEKDEDESTLMEQVWEQTKREIEEEEAQQERDDRSTKQYSRGVFGFR